MMNHANNPVIYGLINRNFREAISQSFSDNKVCHIFRATPSTTNVVGLNPSLESSVFSLCVFLTA